MVNNKKVKEESGAHTGATEGTRPWEASSGPQVCWQISQDAPASKSAGRGYAGDPRIGGGGECVLGWEKGKHFWFFASWASVSTW